MKCDSAPVFLGLVTKDAQALYDKLQQNGVQIIGELNKHAYGMDFQFQDLYGNKFNVRQKKQ